MSKYIDLAEQIHAGTRDVVYLDEVGEVLTWLDSHPDQVPGRTITESELGEVARTHESIRHLVGMLGITVTPDPKPTNLELLQELSREWMRIGKGEFVDFLDERGVKAPGGDDE